MAVVPNGNYWSRPSHVALHLAWLILRWVTLLSVGSNSNSACQLGLAIPLWVDAVTFSESWELTGMWYCTPVLFLGSYSIKWCLADGHGNRSLLPYGLVLREKTLFSVIFCCPTPDEFSFILFVYSSLMCAFVVGLL